MVATLENPKPTVVLSCGQLLTQKTGKNKKKRSMKITYYNITIEIVLFEHVYMRFFVVSFY